MAERKSKQLTLDAVPTTDASWEEINEFAHTYNGYEACGSFEQCADIANERRHETVADLRACLFFEARRFRHFGRDPDEHDLIYIRELVAKLREKLG